MRQIHCHYALSKLSFWACQSSNYGIFSRGTFMRSLIYLFVYQINSSTGCVPGTCSKYFININSPYFSQSSHELDTIITLFLSIKKSGHKEVKQLIQGASEWQSWDSNWGSLAREYMLSTHYIIPFPNQPAHLALVTLSSNFPWQNINIMYLKCIFGHTSEPKVHHASCSGADTDFSNLVCFAELGRSFGSHNAHHPW